MVQLPLRIGDRKLGGWGRTGDSQGAPGSPAPGLRASPFRARPQPPQSCDPRLNHARNVAFLSATGCPSAERRATLNFRPVPRPDRYHRNVVDRIEFGGNPDRTELRCAAARSALEASSRVASGNRRTFSYIHNALICKIRSRKIYKSAISNPQHLILPRDENNAVFLSAPAEIRRSRASVGYKTSRGFQWNAVPTERVDPTAQICHDGRLSTTT